ncbi:MAG: malonyl-CoA decarboxylase family protein, partial [Kiloniellales bacterium]|nr:malonyl-CoA decarboxylase family protein [Kiloniellales bacterium]
LSKQQRGALKELTKPDWAQDGPRAAALKKLIKPLAAYYFLKAKSRDKPVDPVARFHLGNGARLECINWLGDPSPVGLRQAAGMMVNYSYVLKDIEKNHEAFANKGRIVASPQVRKLLQTRKRGTDNG